MIDSRLSELLGFDAYGTFVKNVTTSNFGKRVTLECVFDPRNEPKPYRIVLEGCKKTTWTVFLDSFDPPGSESGNGADLIGLQIGDDQYRSPFIAHADLFEVVIEYRSLRVIREQNQLFEVNYNNINYRLPEEFSDLETVDLIQCAYPNGIPDSHYHTLLSILIADRSIRGLSATIAQIRGGHYSTYMGEVGNATRYEPDPEVKATVMEKLVACGYKIKQD